MARAAKKKKRRVAMSETAEYKLEKFIRKVFLSAGQKLFAQHLNIEK